MASVARYVSGDTRPKPVLCDPNYPIEVGDLLFREPSNNLARPASAMVNQGSATLNQQAFHNQFLGVALQKNGAQSGESVPLWSTINHSPANVIECATAGIFEYDLAAATAFNGGEMIGAAENAAGNGLQDQVVSQVTALANSIGRASPPAAAIGSDQTALAPSAYQGPANVVHVEILSTIFYGGEPAETVGSSSGAM